MATEGKLSDLDYCYASWELLKDLEKNSYSRNECIRAFQEKANARQTLIIGIFAMILPLIVWGRLLLSGNGLRDILSSNVATRLVGLLMVSAFLFVLVFMLLKSFWETKALRPLKKMTEKDLRANLMETVQNIDNQAESIVNHRIFSEGRIPENFLSAEMLPLLIRYFERGQVTIMKEAIYSLKLELQNTGYYTNLMPSETLLQKEREYLSDERSNLEKKIEEGEKL
ncbi:hypothetical protein SAMN02745116_01793 [Pilibacter termitis]|uniref:Uncharacterized protein n=1 Tax=Pilibacter termitis TaxID=263852 RepID=A0A1T4PFP0_9ENTE|nr:hypothetical protein [Pilibacter termitis]SJZ90312.1 hypothetical protein SAMN02745116_01793 [Pilibacter termitis]